MSSLFKFLDVINPYEPTDNPNSIIYLVMMMFTLMFQIAWLQYVAMVLPIFYCNISFRSIIVIKKG